MNAWEGMQSKIDFKVESRKLRNSQRGREFQSLGPAKEKAQCPMVILRRSS